MALLALARALVAAVPFERWRGTLGLSKGASAKSECKRLAAQIEWAAQRLPFSSKCLPRAMALSWLLRAKGISHEVVFAVRPAGQRTAEEALHAWVEIDGQILIGELPGPWLETLRLGKR
jgi:hypothetical protein